MAGNELNQKYTIEKYCTQAEVKKALGTNIIDPFWKEISEFRNRLSIELPIFDANYIRFKLAYVDSIQRNIAQVTDCVSNFSIQKEKLINDSLSEFSFTRDMIKTSLKALAMYLNLDASEVTLRNIIEDKPVNSVYTPLLRYKKALLELRKNSYDEINEEFLAKYYAILRGEEELTSFYRESNIETSSSRALIDRDYDKGVPTRLIDEMIPSLLDYITKYDVAITARLSAIFFMFNYVKPFDSYNMEMAVILAKRILASTNIESASVYIPLEIFLNDNEFFGEISKEIKRLHDFSYGVLSGSRIIKSAFEIAGNKITIVKANAIDKSVKYGEDPEKIKQEFGIEVEKPKTFVKQNETKNEIQRKLERNVKPSVPLTDKEIKAKVEDLLESDPFLKKAQAHFYVTHCTVGKFYTIQEFIKLERCVYETGRTSMDGLVKLGYYKREQIKNKFVYTPIDKE